MPIGGPATPTTTFVVKNTLQAFMFSIELSHITSYCTCETANENGGFQSCDQDFFRALIFPPLPRFQEQLGGKWMTSSQETITSLYSWTSVAVVLLGVGFFAKNVAAPAVQSIYESTYSVSELFKSFG